MSDPSIVGSFTSRLTAARATRQDVTDSTNGQQRNDGPIRRLLPDYSNYFAGSDNPNPYPAGWLNKYRDAWDLLSLEQADDTATEDL